MKAILIGAAFLLGTAGTAGAMECPSLQEQIDKVYGKRFDKQAAVTRATAREAQNLHRAGKHAESVKKYEEAAKIGKITLTHKKK